MRAWAQLNSRISGPEQLASLFVLTTQMYIIFRLVARQAGTAREGDGKRSSKNKYSWKQLEG